MLAVVSRTSFVEGKAKKRNETFLIVGDTFSTAEEFVYKTIVQEDDIQFDLKSLKREPLRDILVDDVLGGNVWYKCEVEVVLEEKKVKEVYYVLAGDVTAASHRLAKLLLEEAFEFEITKVISSGVKEVHQEI